MVGCPPDPEVPGIWRLISEMEHEHSGRNTTTSCSVLTLPQRWVRPGVGNFSGERRPVDLREGGMRHRRSLFSIIASR